MIDLRLIRFHWVSVNKTIKSMSKSMSKSPFITHSPPPPLAKFFPQKVECIKSKRLCVQTMRMFHMRKHDRYSEMGFVKSEAICMNYMKRLKLVAFAVCFAIVICVYLSRMDRNSCCMRSLCHGWHCQWNTSHKQTLKRFSQLETVEW